MAMLATLLGERPATIEPVTSRPLLLETLIGPAS
jgi:hypothetical protein